MSKSFGKPFIPTDDESATKLLNMFNDMAYSICYQEIFTKAANILYGASFLVRTDLSKRMYFRCMICNKDMNNIRSLTDHALSGGHLKNVDCANQNSVDSFDLSKMTIASELSALQEKVARSTVPIVGLNRVEGYCDGRNWYYKCTLCGAHGNADSLYNHLIGDKHTDRYIKSQVVLKSSSITQEERNYFRSVILNKEDFNFNSIITIYDREYYPYIWEKDGKMGYSSKSIKRIYGLEEEIPFPVKEASENEACAFVKEIIVQQPCCSTEYYKMLITKLKTLFFDLSRIDNKFETPEDVQIGLIIISFLLHWLFFVCNSIVNKEKSNNIEGQKQQLKLIMGCLGYVEKRLKVIFKSKYGTEANFNLD